MPRPPGQGAQLRGRGRRSDLPLNREEEGALDYYFFEGKSGYLKRTHRNIVLKNLPQTGPVLGIRQGQPLPGLIPSGDGTNGVNHLYVFSARPCLESVSLPRGRPQPRTERPKEERADPGVRHPERERGRRRPQRTSFPRRSEVWGGTSDGRETT